MLIKYLINFKREQRRIGVSDPQYITVCSLLFCCAWYKFIDFCVSFNPEPSGEGRRTHALPSRQLFWLLLTSCVDIAV